MRACVRKSPHSRQIDFSGVLRISALSASTSACLGCVTSVRLINALSSSQVASGFGVGFFFGISLVPPHPSMLVVARREQRGRRHHFDRLKDRIGFSVFGDHSRPDSAFYKSLSLFLISARFYDLADQLRRFSFADVMRNDAPADALTSVK